MANQESRLAIVIDSKEAEQNIKRLRTALKNIGKETVEAGSGLELLTEAMEPLKKYDSVFTKASGAAKDLAKSTKDMSKEVLAASKGISTLNDDTKKSADSSNKLQNAVDNTAKEVREFGAITDAAGVAVWGMGDKAEESAQDVDKLGDKAKDAKSGLKGLGDEAEKSKSKLEKLKDSVNNFNESMSGLRNAALVGMGALTGILYKSIGSAQEFESAMAEVKKTVDFESPKGIEDMRKGLEELTTQIPQTFGELAATASNAGLLGVAEKDILGFTETVAKMGVAFDLQSDAVAESMAKIANVFQIPIKDIGNLGDVINHLSNNMASTAGEIIDFTKRTASLSATMGLSEDSTAAFGSAMIALGMPAEVAGTAFNAFLGKLANLDGLSKRGKAAFASMGLDATEFAKLMQNDAEAGILKFIETLKDVPKEMQAALAYDALGAELAPKVLAMAAGYEEVARALDMTGDAAGSMEKEFVAISDTSANKMILFKSNIDLVWSSIGDALIPAFNDLLDAMRPFIESMTDWVRENPELVQGIIIVTGAISGLLLGVTGLGLAVSGAMSIFSGLAAVGGVLATALGFVSLPMIAIVAAIAGIIGAGYMLYKHWDEIKAFASETWDSIKNSASEAWEGVTSSVSGLVDDTVASFQDLGSSISDTWSNIKSSTSQNWESIKSTMVSGAQSAIAAAKSAFASLPTPIQNVLTIVYNVVKTQLDLVRNIFSTVLNAIKAAVRGDMQGVVNAFKTGLNNAINIIKTGVSNILSAFSDLGSKLFKIGVDAIQGLINGLKSKMGGLKDTARNLSSTALNALKGIAGFDTHSPSKKTIAIGKDVGQGLANGIKKSTKVVKTESQKLAESAIKSVKDTIANLKKEIVLFGKGDDPLAEINYDISVGKYKGVANPDLEELKALKATRHELDEAKKAAEEFNRANESVTNSIKDINRQLSLLDGSDAVSALMYDLAYTEKYANVTAENIQKLIDKTTELELMRAQGAANDAFYEMTDSMQSESPMGKLIAERDKRLEILEEARTLEVISAQQHTDTLLAIDQAYMDGKRDLLLNQSQDLFSGLSGLAKSFAGEQSGVYRALFAIEKGFAIAQSAIAIKTAVAKAMAAGVTPIDRAVFVGQAIAQGASIMNALKSIAMPVGQAHDGIMSVPKSGTWNLEKGERVLPAHTAKAMDKKLEQGGKVIINNYSGEKAEAKQDIDGNTIITIGKMVNGMIDAKMSNWERKAQRQGGILNRA